MNDIESNMNQITQTAALHIEGKSQREIAKELGVSQSTVCRMLSDSKAKAIIDRVHNRYISAAKGISKQFIKLCYSDSASIRVKAIAEYHRIIGITPSNKPSIFIDKLYNQTNNTVISQDVLELLKSKPKTIDIGYESEEVD